MIALDKKKKDVDGSFLFLSNSFGENVILCVYIFSKLLIIHFKVYLVTYYLFKIQIQTTFQKYQKEKY